MYFKVAPRISKVMLPRQELLNSKVKGTLLLSHIHPLVLGVQWEQTWRTQVGDAENPLPKFCSLPPGALVTALKGQESINCLQGWAVASRLDLIAG